MGSEIMKDLKIAFTENASWTTSVVDNLGKDDFKALETLFLCDNEITDKGYINQRGVLENRAGEVERLYAETPDDEIIQL